MGIETEFGLTSTIESCEDGKEIAEKILEFVKKNSLYFEDIDHLFTRQCKNASLFKGEKINSVSSSDGRVHFSNGDVAYIDCHHIEFDSRECDNPLELAAADQAIVRVADAIIKKFEKENPQFGNLRLYKNNIALLSSEKNTDDSQITTWASHENYQIERRSWERRKILLPYFGTRQVFFAPGNLRSSPINKGHNKFDGYWELSGRAHFIECEEGLDTTLNRSVINTRDEPWMDLKYMRLHLLVGESNMFSYTTALKFGLTSLVLRLMEEADDFNPPQIKNLVPLKDKETKKIIPETGAISYITMHPHSPVEMEDGRRMTAFDILEIYLDEAEKRFGGENGDDDWVLKHCRFLHKTLRTESRSKIDRALNGFLDWTTMFDVLKSFEESINNLEEGEPRCLDISKEEDRKTLMRYKNSFSNLDMEWGLAFRFPLHNVLFPLGPEEVLYKIFDPCFGTRSALRAFAINFYPDKIQSIGWNGVGYHNSMRLDLEKTLITDYKKCASLYNKPPALEDFLEQARAEAFLIKD
ncbi:proteasome accessory factor PafA2 family protein [Candidatus Woesearchaeota archaeon]|nr:proteasome accessory factor PafA2 family protein [Candidatus Woesearchaeota archaeon]